MEYSPEQVLVWKYFPKYSDLVNLTRSAFSGSEATEVNIYIDITKMVSSLYKPDVKILHPLSIASTIINLCAHLRTYYRVYHQVESTFFLVYSDMTNTYNCNLIPDYNKANMDKKEANKVITNAIEIAMQSLQEICPYLPNIYFKRDIFEPAVVMYDIILKEEAAGNINPNIIVTNDLLSYQIVGMHHNTVIFTGRKITDGFELAFNAVTRDTCMTLYWLHSGRKADTCNIDMISPELLGAFISITNLPSRGVKSIFGSRKAVNTLIRIINDRDINNGYVNDIGYLYSCIFKGLSKVSLEMFALRFRAIDLVASHLYYMNTPFALDTSYRLDLQDPEGVQAINNQYFKDNPIDLNRL